MMQNRETWLLVAFVLIVLAVFVTRDVCEYIAVEKASKVADVDTSRADVYHELHIPLFDAQGTPVADILAEEAEWNRTTGSLTFSKPVVYEYADGHLVRRTTGDSGYARTRTGAPSTVTVRGHVKVRCWNRGEGDE